MQAWRLPGMGLGATPDDVRQVVDRQLKDQLDRLTQDNPNRHDDPLVRLLACLHTCMQSSSPPFNVQNAGLCTEGVLWLPVTQAY